MRNILVILLCLPLLFSYGCSTTPATPTPEQVEVSSAKSIIASVEKTRATWADWVVLQRARIHDGDGMVALSEKESRVKAALEKYQALATAAVIGHSSTGLAEAASRYQFTVEEEMK